VNKERSKIGFPYAKKAVKVNKTFFWEFYGKEAVESMY
jgi:hypothetical protein